jgi:hypothetical protein
MAFRHHLLRLATLLGLVVTVLASTGKSLVPCLLYQVLKFLFTTARESRQQARSNLICYRSCLLMRLCLLMLAHAGRHSEGGPHGKNPLCCRANSNCCRSKWSRCPGSILYRVQDRVFPHVRIIGRPRFLGSLKACAPSYLRVFVTPFSSSNCPKVDVSKAVDVSKIHPLFGNYFESEGVA